MSLSPDAAHSSQEQQTHYAFLVQHLATDTSEKNAPGSSNRQKRRRTSPQDHALLETAYQQNSKPDKNQRLEIVSQVALGEKEVQIWFQNRRQCDRRRSRPLLPHELVPHFRNGVPIEVLQRTPNNATAGHESPSYPPLVSTASEELYAELRAHSRASSIHELLNTSSSSKDKMSVSASGPQARVDSDTSPVSNCEAETEGSPPRGVTTKPESEVILAGARKRSHDEITDLTSTRAGISPKMASQNTTMRLAMTAEGAVKIRTSDSATPSPPKERASASDMHLRRSSGLQRSKSAVGAAEMGEHSSPLLSISRAAEGKLGRSRDARTWEFYCDSGTRDSLSSHAEHERNGSAVGAINLIRSQSQRQLRQMLAPVAVRSNARAPAPLTSNGRSKPKIVRAKSSLARLQGADVDFSKSEGKGERPQLVRSPSGDSDKENWAPGTHSSQNPLRRTHTGSNMRAVLADNDSVLSYASKLHGNGDSNVRRIDGKENSQPIPLALKEKGSDLDCVQSLLSLSQGAWR